MEGKNFLAPAEIAEATVEIGVKKASLSIIKMIVLGILAGAFIAFAAEGSNMAAFNLFGKPETFGLGKCLAGAVFGTGLMLVVAAGGELFTGNNLIIMSVLNGRTKLSAMLKNWFFVYIGNFIGALFISYMMVNSGLLNSGANALGGMTIKIAAGKVGLSFTQALLLGIMCNWLVCLAVWLSFGAKDIIGKLFACFFPIWLFVTSGFEHSIANMYYIPAGILAKTNSAWVEASHVSAEVLANLNWSSFVFKNLVPVTIGNLIGGAFFVGTIYWFTFIRKKAAVNSTAKNKVA